MSLLSIHIEDIIRLPGSGFLFHHIGQKDPGKEKLRKLKLRTDQNTMKNVTCVLEMSGQEEQ